MPIETVPGTDLSYHLLAFDPAGEERPDLDGGLASRAALGRLRGEPITDVFFLSHGWMGDLPAARRPYNDWVGPMPLHDAAVPALRSARPLFRPLLPGLHWPSRPF